MTITTWVIRLAPVGVFFLIGGQVLATDDFGTVEADMLMIVDFQHHIIVDNILIVDFQLCGLLCLLPCLPCLVAPLLAPESPRLLLLRGLLHSCDRTSPCSRVTKAPSTPRFLPIIVTNHPLWDPIEDIPRPKGLCNVCGCLNFIILKGVVWISLKGERTLALDSLQWLRGELADLGQVFWMF